MTDHFEPGDDGVLAGIDGPRPLPAGLRQRLEDRLLVDAARELEPELAGRLSETLIGGPAKPAGPAGRRVRPRLVAAVAAGLLVAGGIGLAVERAAGSGPAAHSAGAAAHSAGPGYSGPPSSASRFSAPRAAGPAAFGAAGRVPDQGAEAGPSAEVPLRPAPAPAVTSVTPGKGPAAGGTWVTITGRGLTGVTGVRFGSAAAGRYAAVSATEVRALTPAGTPGTVTVTVVVAGRPLTAAGSFTYTGG